jgi:thiol-disulfide isomerase/thioredoxin
MMRVHLIYLLTIAALAFAVALSPLPTSAQNGSGTGAEPVWFEDKGDDVTVHLYFFWSKTCPHCQKAHPFVDALAQQYPWLTLHSLELTEYPDHVQQYVNMAAALGLEAQYVPAFFACGSMTAGYDRDETSGAALVKSLEQCHATALAAAAATALPARSGAGTTGAGGDTRSEVGAADAAAGAAAQVPSAAPALSLPLLGTLDAQSLSLPAFTLVVAGLDAFNPCAFFVLMFLLSLMVHAQSRARMALIGGVFVICSGLLYFVFMAAWLNIFLVVGELALITTIAGLVAIVIAVINIKDFFWFRQGVSLSIADSAKPSLYQRSRNVLKASSLGAMLAGTAVLAVAANSYELLCTSGFPMVYTRTLTLQNLPTPTFYLYLALYNLIYVLPLLVIVAIFTVRFGARKLTEEEGRVLKLLSGLMMLLLGIVLVVAPMLLNDVMTALALLLVTLVVTGVLVWIDRHRLHPSPAHLRKS